MNTIPNKKNEADDNNNYSFLLKCMAGVGAALVAAGIITAIALTTSAKTAAATSMAVGATAAAFTFTPIIPIVGIAALIIASICVLPFLFSSRSTYVVGGSPGYRNSGFFGSSIFTPPIIVTPGSGHHHNHHHNHHHGHGGGFGGGSVFGGGGIFGGGGTVHHGSHSGSNDHGHTGGSVHHHR
ncbi:hypothetical protein [Legionella quateirensis]|uniref:Transmembrane protein n=1 Tax=Legionella quateirensis TaxID=45072 RepID=A0A378KW47_9GAMM|nr:hypothetical protein [Legionella quateirensis]KTD51178.1 hypothetical protein Lqua_1405 [Legionella quateirensis]STY17578.1 Uncharacterised protein [Legionella quateirensis]